MQLPSAPHQHSKSTLVSPYSTESASDYWVGKRTFCLRFELGCQVVASSLHALHYLVIVKAAMAELVN